MKIAVFHATPPGGARRAVVETTTRLGASHDVEVFQQLVDGDPGPSWPGGLRVRSRSVAPRAGSTAGRRLGFVGLQHRWLRAQREVARAIDRLQVDVALIHPCSMTQSPEVIRHLSTPTVYYAQEIRRRTFEAGYVDPITGPAWRRAVGSLLVAGEEARPRRVDARAMSLANAVLCNSVFSAEAIDRSYGRRATVSYLGVDEGRFTVPAEDGARGDYVLLVGGLERAKGALDVVQALARIPGKARPSLVVVGQRHWGPFESALRIAAADGGVRLDVRIDVPEEGLVDLYRRARATCCVARLEPFGLTTVESIACGTPVVAVNEGGYREVVQPGRNGVLVERGADSIAGAIVEVAAAAWDRDDLRRSVLPRFGLEMAVERLDAHLRAAVGRTPGGMRWR